MSARRALLPRTLVLIRHGESNGNEAALKERSGDLSGFTDEYRDTPSSTWGLTRRGFRQAIATGLWLPRFVLQEPHVSGDTFDKIYISPHTRSRQTMGGIALNMPLRSGGVTIDARLDLRLREQDFGDISTMPKQEYRERYPDNARTRQTDKLYWRPPGGESVADVADRVRSFLGALARTHERGTESVLVVSHGRQISATQIVLEGIDPHEWANYLDTNEIKNTQVVQYARMHPETGEESLTYRWTRSVCPWETPDSPGVWREFEAPRSMTIAECLEGIPPEWLNDPPVGIS